MADERDALAALETVLIEHQRHRGGCLCGWSKLGYSHPEHQAEQIIAAGWRAPLPVTCSGNRHVVSPMNALVCQCGQAESQWGWTDERP